MIAVGFGLKADAVREDLLVPLTFSGPGTKLFIGYEGVLRSGILQVRADLGLAILFNRFLHPAITMDHGLGASWVLPVLHTSAWQLALGPALVFESRTSYLASWDDAHGYWLATEWLGAKVRYTRNFSLRWDLESNASMSWFAFQGRPPTVRYNKQDALDQLHFYMMRPLQNQVFVTVDKLQIFHINVVFHQASIHSYGVGTGWSFGLETRFVRTSIPATAINVSACIYLARGWGI